MGRLIKRERQVYVIELFYRNRVWQPFEIHGHGGPTCEGGGLPFYKTRLRSARARWPKEKFRLTRYIPEQ